MQKKRSHIDDMVCNISGKNICRYIKCIRKEITMEICYDGALVMPKNYAVVNEEEMTYVEGGISVGPIYANDAADMYKAVRSAANGMYVPEV
ncbi:MAG: hypothetical protein Q4D76_14285 [Oscillospiraceae bacterium]|nr:hypothetical protein [Oscillospiraceae bacterium]